MTARLITIPISHFCEKARWALDRAGIPYVEERHVQGFSVVRARMAGGGLTTPVLVTDEGAIGESEDIVRWADRVLPPEQRLVPEDAAQREDALALSRGFDKGLGPAGRRLIYAHMLGHKAAMMTTNNQGVPGWEAASARALFPLMGLAVRVRLRMGSAEPQPADERIVLEAFDLVAERLADGRPFLCGERFTIADLTFAALAAPAVGPSNYGVRLPPADELPPGAAAMVRTFRAHPAGAYALRLTETERPPANGAATGPAARAGTTR